MPSPSKPRSESYDPDRVRASVRAIIARLGTNPRALSVKAGVAEGSLRRFLAGATRSLELESAMRMAVAAGVSLSEFVGEPAPALGPVESGDGTDADEVKRRVLKARQLQLRQSGELDDLLADLARLLARTGQP
jgi:lambda repressor-like predicted transcriptional regulator